jgi:hypothetical protein
MHTFFFVCILSLSLSLSYSFASFYRLIVDLFLRLIEIVHTYVSPNLSHCSQVNVYCVIFYIRSSNSKRCVYIWTRFVTVSFHILEKNNREEKACLSWCNVLVVFSLSLSLYWGTQAWISSIYFFNLDASMYTAMMSDNLCIYDSYCLLGRIVEKTNRCYAIWIYI